MCGFVIAGVCRYVHAFACVCVCVCVACARKVEATESPDGLELRHAVSIGTPTRTFHLPFHPKPPFEPLEPANHLAPLTAKAWGDANSGSKSGHGLGATVEVGSTNHAGQDSSRPGRRLGAPSFSSGPQTVDSRPEAAQLLDGAVVLGAPPISLPGEGECTPL